MARNPSKPKPFRGPPNMGPKSLAKKPTQSKAGDNEKKFRRLFSAKASKTPLLGKKRYKLHDVEISVDDSFEYDGMDVLVEIDSGNMAKLLVGQYMLLNCLRKSDKPAFFLIIHAYKKFSPLRTLKNLGFVNQHFLNGNGIEFGALHLNTIESWSGDLPDLFKLANDSINTSTTALSCKPRKAV